MHRVFAHRHLLTAVVLVAGLAAAVLGAGVDTDAIEGIQIGLLAVGFPKVGPQRTCNLCTWTRQQTSDYAPVPHYMGGPKRIILMRHADKTDDPSNEDLSDAGVERAKRLATYIPETFGRPDIIIATAHSKHSDRPKETLEPLADALDEGIQHYFEKDEFPDLIDEIMNDPDYKNKTVVICWHHKELPAMAALLGAPSGSYPDPWPDDAYNVIIDLQYDPFSGSPPKVTRVIEPF